MFGLKSKVLLSVSALLVIVVGCYLYFATSLITKDKRTYILENTLATSEEVKNIIGSTLKDSLFQSEALVLALESDVDQLKEVFDKQDRISALRYNEGKEEKVLIRSNLASLGESYTDYIKSWAERTHGRADGLQVKKIEKINAFEVIFGTEEKSLEYVLDMNHLWTKISSDTNFKYIIYDKKGKVAWKTGEEISLNDLSSELRGQSSAIVKELNIGGEDFIVSIVPVQNAGLYVLSYIPSKTVFAIIGDLTLDMIAFGLILLGAALLMGHSFSSKIVRPIYTLMDGADAIAAGNFNSRVEINTGDELSVLGDRFNFMGSQIYELTESQKIMIEDLREANVKIEDYSKNLERKVAERTRDLNEANQFIQAMINSLDQGLFVIDKEMKVAPIYTKACEEMYNTNPANRNFTEILSLTGEQKENVSQWVDVIFSEMIPFDSAVELGIKNKTYGDSLEDKNFKSLRLNYYPMRDTDEKITNLVVVGTDITSEEKAKEKARKRERYVEMIFKILAAKKQFMELLDDVDDYIHGLDKSIDDKTLSLDNAMMIYHTLNGAFGIYAVDSMIDEVRKCEQTLVNAKKTGAKDLVKIKAEKENFKKNFATFRKTIIETLGVNANTLEIRKEVVAKLKTSLQLGSLESFREIFETEVLTVPVSEMFVSYNVLIETLSKKLNKELSPLKIVGGDIRLDPEKYKDFFSVLVHVFRNSADHGIETPELRMKAGKQTQGTISVNVKKSADSKNLILSIEDDGGGIDPAKVRKKLLEKNPGNTKYASETDQQIIHHIFDQDFSTAEQLTAISGRGVGMSAVKDIVDQIGGKISIASQVGKGTRFTFEIPQL